MRIARWLLALVVSGLLLGPAAADELVGSYDASGTTPDEKPYEGAVQIQQVGNIHIVLWKLNDGETYKGFGIRQGDVLGAAYGAADTKFGLVVYQVKGGTLSGLWATSSDLKSELGKETLEGSPDLKGVYKITLGQNRDGMTNYGGQVQISRKGDSYFVIWPTKPASVGIGVRVNDMLVVAYTSNPTKMPGVVAYQTLNGGALGGIWSLANIKQTGEGSFDLTAPDKVGREDLKRAP